jgi:hypothetical protein
MAGFGTMGAGTGPVGLGTPVSGSAPPAGAAGCRYINPATKDYQIDPATRQQAQMPAVRQQVLLAITTLAKSATTIDWLGIRMPRKMGDRFQAETEVSVRAALRHLTDTQRVIRIDSIKAEHGRGGRGAITVSWSEIKTGKKDSVSTRG